MPEKSAAGPVEGESPSKRQKVSDADEEPEIKVAVPTKCILGESPVWDGGMKRLLFVDIQGKILYAWDPATRDLKQWETPDEVGCVVPYKDNIVLIAVVDKILQVDMTKEGKDAISDFAVLPDGHCPAGFRFNDGKCDPSGRLWVGTMNKDWRNASAPKGKLYCMGPDKKLETKLEEVGLSNGMGWFTSAGEDGFDSMFFIDSAKQQVARFDYDDSTGAVSNERVTVTVPKADKGGGTPDGMTVDSDGKVWVAIAGGGCVAQYDPKTGEELRRVVLPVERPTACTFGGADLDTLYVTTREPADQSPAPSEAGAVLAVRVPGVRGHRPAWAYRDQE